MTTGICYSLEVHPILPEKLKGLRILSNDLLYSWDHRMRYLFQRLDPDVWEQCGHNPKLFLRRVSQKNLESAAKNRVYMEDYNRVMSAYNTYHREKTPSEIEKVFDPETDLIAYFCAEFGLHESLPIYSGGLGILAGDHCKAASDLRLPFVAVGMLYRHGYFEQTIDQHGRQIAHYQSTDFGTLPLQPAQIQNQDIYIEVELPNRPLTLKVWQAMAGHIKLYLLDSDIDANSDKDRRITDQLYGGDIYTRIQQEIVLGIGGVRALRTLGHKPTVWHINEGHAAFMVVERCREFVSQGMEFNTALELVAAGTVFTTHTPVPAGHDIFSKAMISEYFTGFAAKLGISFDHFFSLGSCCNHPDNFNQTVLALRGSRFHNGVSRIHGGVASQMESAIWPQVPASENPIGYVTNGVHIPTFLAHEWINVFNMRFGSQWRNEFSNADYWHCIDEIPDHSFWSVHQSLKTELLDNVRKRLCQQKQRNGCSPTHINRATYFLQKNDSLIVGFARRFATYKRAHLLFSDPERLARLVNDKKRPVLFIFAGKAHPHDQPGQQLIAMIHEFSRKPEFEGKIILLEGYDLALARHLIAGVDVWLNTPTYPLEASGTSGQKAGINGVINLSILDGWWGEGYDGENGWAINPHKENIDPKYRDQEEGQEILSILEHEIIPMYYNRDGLGYSAQWVKKSKTSMKTLLPRFNSQRMVMDYIEGYYSPANQQQAKLMVNQAEPAKALAEWKQKVHQSWPSVKAERRDQSPTMIQYGDSIAIQVSIYLGQLSAEDVIVECLVDKNCLTGDFEAEECIPLEAKTTNAQGETLFEILLQPIESGLQQYKLRIFPYHIHLSHPFELGYMIWV